MSYKTVKATCRSCNGLGWYESSEWQTDRGWSDYYTKRYYGCDSCGGSGNEMEVDKIKKGSGKESVKIKTFGGTCSSCDGTGKTASRWREEGTDSSGREYRKDFDRTDSCSSCFGTGEKCAEVSSKTCDKCNGSGGFYYWEKSSFSSKEYKKERKCEQCNGAGRIENLVGYWASTATQTNVESKSKESANSYASNYTHNSIHQNDKASSSSPENYEGIIFSIIACVIGLLFVVFVFGTFFKYTTTKSVLGVVVGVFWFLFSLIACWKHTVKKNEEVSSLRHYLVFVCFWIPMSMNVGFMWYFLIADWGK
jgi:hypothetical protein